MIAARVVSGDANALARGLDPAVAAEVSHIAADLLIGRAAEQVVSSLPEAAVWPRAQAALVALAAVPGADSERVAEALLEAVMYESVHGEGDALDVETLLLLLDEVGPAVADHVGQRDRFQDLPPDVAPRWSPYAVSHPHFLISALTALPGQAGADWLVRLVRMHGFQNLWMRRSAWSPDDWRLRLEALSEALLDDWYLRSGWWSDAPRSAAVAVVRYVCAYGTEDPAGLARWAGRLLGAWETGDLRADLELFWWDAPEEQLGVLRWVLELASPAGDRERLVDAAADAGLIDDSARAFLRAPLQRPVWAFGESPWMPAELRDAPARAFDGTTHPAREVIAVHPRKGYAVTASEILVSPGMPVAWQLQSGQDRTWIGFGSDGDVRRVIADLGLLPCDPRKAEPPWYVMDDNQSAPAPFNVPAGPDDLLALAREGASLATQRAALAAALTERGLTPHTIAAVLAHTRDGLLLGAARGPGRSRLGGEGRLPVGADWPTWDDTPLTFVAEIALGELPAVQPLPPDGSLLIFMALETVGFENPMAGTRVLYVPEGQPIQTAPHPPGAYAPFEAKALSALAMPIAGESDLVVEALENVPDQREKVIEVMNDLVGPLYHEHWLLGATIDIQGPPLSAVGSLLGDFDDDQRTQFTPAELDGHGWTLLAQFNEDPQAGLVWGDGGNVKLLIPATDLRAARFDRVILTMECH